MTNKYQQDCPLPPKAIILYKTHQIPTQNQNLIRKRPVFYMQIQV